MRTGGVAQGALWEPEGPQVMRKKAVRGPCGRPDSLCGYGYGGCAGQVWRRGAGILNLPCQIGARACAGAEPGTRGGRA